jgi:IclR family acetate operon transcriptional repressor
MVFTILQASPPQGAQAALRAIRLLKLFTPERREMSLGDVSKIAGLNKTTTHRLLRALQSEAMIDQNSATGLYRLGPGLMALGVQALSSSDLRLRVRPILKRLAKDSGETVTLEVPIDDSMLILDEVTGAHVIGAGGNVGTRWPLHATSTGKAVIAFDDSGILRLGDELQSLTPNTIVDRSVLEGQFGNIRRRGFAESVDELEDGFSGVATVVRGGMGEVLGALSICGPTQRLTSACRARLGASLRVASDGLQL